MNFIKIIISISNFFITPHATGIENVEELTLKHFTA